jgi:hypothetical protein
MLAHDDAGCARFLGTGRGKEQPGDQSCAQAGADPGDQGRDVPPSQKHPGAKEAAQAGEGEWEAIWGAAAEERKRYKDGASGRARRALQGARTPKGEKKESGVGGQKGAEKGMAKKSPGRGLLGDGTFGGTWGQEGERREEGEERMEEEGGGHGIDVELAVS